MQAKTLAITAGEPAGIGPDLCVQLAQQPGDARRVVLADREVLQARARLLGLPLKIIDYRPDNTAPAPARSLEVWHHETAVPVQPGILNPANSRYVLHTLESATQACLAGDFAALVTAPLHKGVINDAGIPFIGHTEFLAELSRTPQVVMILVGGGLRVALATTHVALKDVAAAISRDSLEAVLRVLHHDLERRFGLPEPKILVAGLNPHAGESGHLGREEIDVIIPVLEKLRGEGLNLVGPLPADTLFTPRQLEGSACQLAMYHDQGLAVLKYASFGQGVNVTLGLPFIRTSVDHGTALDLAGTGKAEVGSLIAAIRLAQDMAEKEKHT